MEFAGDGTPLTDECMRSAADRLQVGPAEIWAVVRVETSGCGYLPDRRPRILFERHIFHRETGGQFDATAPDVSQPNAGGYGAGGAHQYERLARAISLDRAAALRSASWGIGQVMGFNAEAAGYADVEAMVEAMVDSEDAQLVGMFQFIMDNGLHRPMQRHDWTAFARGYNGLKFAINQYDQKLAREFARLSSRGVPDLRIRLGQVLLMYCGVDPGPIDGLIGKRTRRAVKLFQQSAGLPATGKLDDATMAALRAA